MAKSGRDALRRAEAARNFPQNTCPASRHVQLMGEALASGKPYPMLQEDPRYCAEDLLSVVASLYETRTALDDQGAREGNAASERELAALLEYAKGAPRVTADAVRELAQMPAHELRRRCIVHRDWHQLFAQCLDGLPVQHIAGAAPNGCWEPSTVRRVVEALLAERTRADDAKAQNHD